MLAHMHDDLTSAGADSGDDEADDGEEKGAGGILWVVATPIGNLGDFGERAIDVLRHADLILAEDTRVTRRLLDAHGLAGPLQSLHDHNEAQRAAALVSRLEQGARLALVSDAGTPLLSDPGYQLVRLAQEHKVAVRVVPGPSAITAALSVSALPTRPFWFEGFLPSRGSARRTSWRNAPPSTSSAATWWWRC